MRRYFLWVFLMLAASQLFGDDLLYRSNDFGMCLERIAPYQKDAFRWILRVRRSGSNEQRLLYDSGRQVRRWDASWNRERTQRVERETLGTLLAARRLYDASGGLLQEDEYTAGKLSKKTIFSYADARLVRRRVLGGPDERQISEDLYIYAVDGGLREVRRTLAAGEPIVSSSTMSSSGLAEERSSMGGSLFIERYDPNGRLVNRERRDSGVLVSIEDFLYDQRSKYRISSVERLPAENGLVERRYDSSGRLSRETKSVKGRVQEVLELQYDENGKVTSKMRSSSEGLETWKYSYSDSGQLSREEYFRRSIRVKATIYGAGKLRTEELYRDGELFLKVYYDGDTRLREEVYTNGNLQLERRYR
jgi:antitoxin component YwqK of YwqJK toxin-antitoxin module